MDRRNFLLSGAAAVGSPAAAFAAETEGIDRPIAKAFNATLRTSSLTRGGRHRTTFLEAGPPSGPTIILIHGWPEISLAWRHQLQSLSTLGFRVIAPDLRGCGQSTVYREQSAYTQREIVRDMIDLADELGIERAVWVGHDWGAAVAWNIASHHASRCHAVAALCVPYDTLERGVSRLSMMVNRELYPAAEFPAGQYEYAAFYQDHFADVLQVFDGHVEDLLKVILRRGDPSQAGKIFATAMVRKQGGWFGPGRPPPSVPLDAAILDEATLASYVEAYKRTGFFGINSFYMNDASNIAYANEAANGGVLAMPILFLSGLYDFVNDTDRTSLLEPMKAKCRKLTTRVLSCGHWMQNERPAEVNAALVSWIATSVQGAWPVAA